MLSLPQLYGFYTTGEVVEMDKAYKPFAMSNIALTAAFDEAKKIRNRVFSEEAENMNDREWCELAGELNGMQTAFSILGVLEEYYSFMRAN